MRNSTRCRLVGGPAIALIFGGLTAVSSTPAHAAVLYPGSSGGAVYASFEAQPGCNVSGYATKQLESFDADGVARTISISSEGTAVKQTDPADITTATVSTTATVAVSQAGGQLSGISAHASYTAQSTAALGEANQCGLRAAGVGIVAITFDLIKPTLMTVQSTSSGMLAASMFNSGTAPAGLNFDDSDAASIWAISTGPGRTTATSLLQPGTYTGTMTVMGIRKPNGTSSGEGSIVITFDEPGIAMSKASGSGKKYVVLPEADNCSNNTAVVTWTKKAGKKKSPKVKKAVFKVGGVKVGQAKAKLATKGKTTVLRNLPANKAFTIEGTITLKSGKKVTVERDYQACR